MQYKSLWELFPQCGLWCLLWANFVLQMGTGNWSTVGYFLCVVGTVTYRKIWQPWWLVSKLLFLLYNILTSFLPCCMECRRSSHEKAVCPSVCPFVCKTRRLWQNERKFCSHFYTIWKNVYPSFWTQGMVDGGLPLLLEILGQTEPDQATNTDFNWYLLVACQL